MTGINHRGVLHKLPCADSYVTEKEKEKFAGEGLKG